MSRGNSARGVVIGKVDFEEDSLKAVTEEKWDVEKEKRKRGIVSNGVR